VFFGDKLRFFEDQTQGFPDCALSQLPGLWDAKQKRSVTLGVFFVIYSLRSDI